MLFGGPYYGSPYFDSPYFRETSSIPPEPPGPPPELQGGGGGAVTLRSDQYRELQKLIQKSMQADREILDITTILILSGILDQ